MTLLLLKALHIIGFVAWFAGLFYLIRILVYHTEALDLEDAERKILTKQYNIMEWRVYRIICNPAMMVTWIGGLGMIYIYGMDWFKDNTWLHVKLVLVLMLTGYHLYCKSLIKKYENGQKVLNSFQMRLFNEIPTIFLFCIVLLAVFRNAGNVMYIFGGVLIVGIILFIFAKLYKKKRSR